MMQDFLRLAQKNTAKNLETCGVLAGSLVSPVVLFFFPLSLLFISHPGIDGAKDEN